jgi:hypothetical protein
MADRVTDDDDDDVCVYCRLDVLMDFPLPQTAQRLAFILHSWDMQLSPFLKHADDVSRLQELLRQSRGKEAEVVGSMQAWCRGMSQATSLKEVSTAVLHVSFGSLFSVRGLLPLII